MTNEKQKKENKYELQSLLDESDSSDDEEKGKQDSLEDSESDELEEDAMLDLD